MGSLFCKKKFFLKNAFQSFAKTQRSGSSSFSAFIIITVKREDAVSLLLLPDSLTPQPQGSKAEISLFPL